MDYKAIINNLLISGVEKQSQQAAGMFRIFERHGIDALEAMQILLELGAVLGRLGESAGERGTMRNDGNHHNDDNLRDADCNNIH